MSNFSTPVKDGQAPARRFGGCVAVVVVLFGCLCLAGISIALNRTSFEILQTSLRLQSSGVTTTGTVVDVEEHPGAKPISNSTFYLFVEFVVDGQTYRIKSNTFYPARGSSWVGETMPIIYDPKDPNIAQIDTFDERWFDPILSVLPF